MRVSRDAAHRVASRRVGDEKHRNRDRICVANRFRSYLLEFTPRPNKSDVDPVFYLASNDRNEYLVVILSFSLFSDLTVTRIWFYTRIL